VVLHVGDTVQIALTGCADCGYSWRMTGQPSPVVFSYQGEQSSTPGTTSTSAGQPPIVGQPVTWTWTFKAVSAHTTGFTAGYFPPGQGTKATQNFAVQLRVAA
jgi:predicted secreted protein